MTNNHTKFLLTATFVCIFFSFSLYAKLSLKFGPPASTGSTAYTSNDIEATALDSNHFVIAWETSGLIKGPENK